MNKTKIEKPMVTTTLYCPHCDKKIVGINRQAENNLAVHILTQHKDLINVEVKQNDNI